MKRFLILAAIATLGCDAKRQDKATIEIVQAEQIGEQLALELKYPDCPGDARRVIRLDRSFTACAGELRGGDRLEAEIATKWLSDRGAYRNEIVRIGKCPVKLDPKEEANFEMVQVCTDIVATGAVVGVHCDRSRPKELVTKCPWLKRR